MKKLSKMLLSLCFEYKPCRIREEEWPFNLLSFFPMVETESEKGVCLA